MRAMTGICRQRIVRLCQTLAYFRRRVSNIDRPTADNNQRRTRPLPASVWLLDVGDEHRRRTLAGLLASAFAQNYRR